jgi:hypothetical protein
MTNAQEITNNLIHRMKNLQEFVVERDWDLIPAGVIKLLENLLEFLFMLSHKKKLNVR